MRIVQINSTCGTGSIGRITGELAEAFEQKGHISYVFYALGTPVFHASTRIGSDLDHKCHALLSRLTGLQGYFSCISTNKLIRQLRQIKPDVVHLQNLHSNYINLKLLLRYLAEDDIPTVITLHDCWFYTGKCTYYIEANCNKWRYSCGDCPLLHKDNVNPTFFFDRTAKCLEDKKKWLGKIPRLAVIGVSKWVVREAAKSFLGNRNPVEIYNWIDTRVFYPRDTIDEIRKNLGAKDRFVIIMVTTYISRKKGFDVLQMLAERCDENVQIVVIGKNPDKLKIPENVIHIPHTNDANELAEYYSMADVCVNTTWYETFGMVTAEAMCCGTPVIVYNNTASPELVVEGCGHVVDQRKGNQAILDAVAIVRNNGKEAYSDRCVEYARQVFSRENGVAQYIELCEKMQKKEKKNETDLLCRVL